MSEYGEVDTQKVKRVGRLAFWVFVLLGIITFFWTIETVDAGSVKVVTRFGAVTGRVLSPGFNLIMPFADSTRQVNTKFLIYETMKSEDMNKSESDYKDAPVDTNTKDGQGVDVYYTVTFSIDGTRATQVINEFGTEELMVDKLVRAKSRSIARIIPSNFTADELYVGTGKEAVGNLIFESLKADLENKGIILDSVLIREIGFTDEYKTAIERKQIEAVNVETAKNVALRAEEEKKARITQAQAEAEAQRLQRETLSDQVIQKELVDALKEGKIQLPQTLILGNGQNLSDFILNLPNK